MFFLDAITEIKDFIDWPKFMTDIGLISTIIKVLLAVVLGGTIGLQRATKKHAAGFRTYILVCVGACMATLTSVFMLSTAGLTTDPARLGAQVISGIGFLGAGTILITSKNQIKGLTTAAGLWTSAAMGLAIGIGFYSGAIICFVSIFCILAFLPRVEEYFTERTRAFDIHIEFEDNTKLRDLITHLRNSNLRIKSVEKNMSYSSTGLSAYSLTVEMAKTRKRKSHSEIINEIRQLPYIYHIEETY